MSQLIDECPLNFNKFIISGFVCSGTQLYLFSYNWFIAVMLPFVFKLAVIKSKLEDGVDGATWRQMRAGADD